MPGVYTRMHKAYPLEAALAIAVSLCCRNPAKLAKREHDLGRVEPGYIGNALLVKIEVLCRDEAGVTCSLVVWLQKGRPDAQAAQVHQAAARHRGPLNGPSHYVHFPRGTPSLVGHSSSMSDSSFCTTCINSVSLHT